MDHDDYEVQAFKEICARMAGCHFTKEEVDKMKKILDGCQIIDPNYVRKLCR